ncbi:MAG: UDP-N-acetylmuramoyl-tripeptide--D-alanyl-D-alanine ligase, partial [Angelakisella sp.]
LAINHDTQAAVIEMGMSGFGEIRELALAAKPQIGVITNIGVSHMEYLGSRENILKAKLELAECLPDGATLFLCSDNDLLKTVEIPRLNVVFYGVDSEKAKIKGTVTHSTPTQTDFTISFDGRQWAASIPGTGIHLVQNALAAFGIGLEFGMEPQAAIKALSDYRPAGMRQNIVDCKGITIVEDCYNASPDSLSAALRTLAELPCTGKRYAVLSDMLELGTLAHEGHRECGELAAHCADVLLLWGDFAADYAEGAQAQGIGRVEILQSKDDLAELLAKELRAGDVAWFKASRGMALEECIEELYHKIGC